MRVDAPILRHSFKDRLRDPGARLTIRGLTFTSRSTIPVKKMGRECDP